MHDPDPGSQRTPADAAIEFSVVSRRYGNVLAVDAVSLVVNRGEFFSMLGPSGSGKTTCLRLIAGFEQPNGGSVRLNGKEVNGVPPYERDVNTVFQDYALFPHLSVIENVEYGLRAKRIAGNEARRRAGVALEQVALSGYGERRPAQLSGGQRQRVALARAIVNRPSVLLLDEPLGSLDLRLREQMQIELRKLHRQLGITFVYVTHDQQEAMSMSDRIAVFSRGRIEQVDTPRTLYKQPVSSFVAEFVGGSNTLRAELAKKAGGNDTEILSIRPEQIDVVACDVLLRDGYIGLAGILVNIQYQGANSRYEVDVGGQIMVIQFPSGKEPNGVAIGNSVQLTWLSSDTVHLNH